MPRRHRDFDAARAEATDEPLIATINGRDYTLPSSVPLAVLTLIEKVQADIDEGADPEDTLTEDEAIEFAKKVFGAHVYAQMETDGITIDQLNEVIAWALEEWTGVDVSGEAPAATRPQRRAAAKGRKKTTARSKTSSRTGRSSKPTGRGSTRKT